MQQEFGLTDGQIGWLFSGFFWSYAILQIPTGLILDRFGVTTIMRVTAFLWSIASGATAFAGGFGGIRKTVLVVGMLLGLAVFGATLTTDPFWAIVWISVALSGLSAAAPVGWSIPSLIAPRGGTATIGAVMNFFNNIMGVIAPIATGYIVGATGSFQIAFLVAGIILLVGIFFFVVVLGRLNPIPDEPAK